MISAIAFIKAKKLSVSLYDIKQRLGITPSDADRTVPASTVTFPDIIAAQLDHEQAATPTSEKTVITRSERKLDILAKNPKVKYYAQHNTCALNIIQQFQHNNEMSFVMSSVAGNGKTFAVSAAIHEMLPWLKSTLSEFHMTVPVMWLTKDNAVLQTRYVAEELFGIKREDLLVVNYENLRSSAGIKEYLKWEVQSLEGIETEVISWRPGRQPALLVCDESHTVGNPNAKITKVLAAYVMTTRKPRLLLTSATVATRATELMLAMLKYEVTEEMILEIRKKIC
jgi:hypothetical protein